MITLANKNLKFRLNYYYSLTFLPDCCTPDMTCFCYFYREYCITGSLKLHAISYNIATGILTCISTGGPVTNLTWNRRGESYSQSKIIVDTVSATYHNLQYISSNTLSDYTGIFTCTVSNSRGSAFQAVEFKCKDIVCLFYIHCYYFAQYSILAVGLKGNKSIYGVGSQASVICYTNLTVVSMRWLVQSSKVSFSINQTRINEIQLKVSDGISKDTHGTKFTCEVINRLPTGTTETSTAVFIIETLNTGIERKYL